MNKIWIISDTHFNHNAIVDKYYRPSDHTDQLIKNCKSKITNDDLVIHLGDVIFGKNSTLKKLLSEIPGRKILTRGNHDHKSNIWYMNNGFDFSCDRFDYVFEGTRLVFSHKPIHTIKINIHGHFHEGNHRLYSDYDIKDSSKHILISLEKNKYQPTLLTQKWIKSNINT